jgi:hypothetical protein
VTFYVTFFFSKRIIPVFPVSGKYGRTAEFTPTSRLVVRRSPEASVCVLRLAVNGRNYRTYSFLCIISTLEDSVCLPSCQMWSLYQTIAIFVTVNIWRARDRNFRPRLNWILPSSVLLRGVRSKTDVSGPPIGPIFKDEAVWDGLNIEDGTHSSKTSVSNHFTPRNNPEDGRI